MENISNIIKSEFTKIEIDLKNTSWHLTIPNKAGWYFIETNTPPEVFVGLSSPPSEYVNESGEMKKCRNYNIPMRVQSLHLAQQVGFIISSPEIRPVYSGMAKKLRDRAREHTFGHQGTAALALANYSDLHQYKWIFSFKENLNGANSPAHADIALKLGEQMWRATYGWPILCSN